MHTYKIILTDTAEAGEALTANTFVTMNNEGKLVKATNNNIVGVIDNDFEAGELVAYHSLSVVGVIAGATLQAGNTINVNSNGQAIAGSNPAHHSVGVCLESCSAGELAKIKMYV